MSAQEDKRLVRFLTCGSVDDGKSTLIGRLLYESGEILADQLAALEADSKKFGTTGGELDFALLLDGLAAEREQGITIDVAYRFFATPRTKFIVADTPGHEQYTRNMATGASTADVAVILVDARKGALTQTRRHLHIVSLLGIRQVVLAVNKMDAAGYSAQIFERIVDDLRSFAGRIGLERIAAIPLSALKGDNVTAPSASMPWYRGPTLLGCLESVEVEDELRRQPFRLPVQSVVRPDQDFRGLAGTLAGGVLRAGDRVRVLPSGAQAGVARIVTMDGDLAEAMAGQSVVVVLDTETDASRGDMLVAADAPATLADLVQATVIWLHEQPMLPGRSYLLKAGARTVNATVTPLKYKVNVDTLEHVAARRLDMNEIGICDLELDQPIAFDPYAENRATGSFILIDRETNDTLGAGLIRFALRRSGNISWQALDIDKRAHARLKGQKPCVIWLTGLSGAGKSTIANLVEKKLCALGRHTYLLDGDNVRHGLNKDLGFTDTDRVENIRRIAEVARLMVEAGLIVIVSFISPFRSERRMARALLEPGEFFEVYVETPLAVAEQRDPKGLYRKARRGEIRHFTGIDSPYEPPEHAEIRIDTVALPPEEAAERIVATLAAAGMLAGHS